MTPPNPTVLPQGKSPVTPPEIKTFSHRFAAAEEPSSRLAIVLHGLGDSSGGFVWMPKEMELPWLNYLLINAPNPYTFDGFSWYEIDNPQPGIETGRALLRDLFAELEEQGWESRDILLFGFSQGCVMSIDFSLRWDKPLAGVVGVSGYVWLHDGWENEIVPQAREREWLVTHGMYDPLLPLERTKAQVDKLVNQGLKIEWHEFGKDHTIDMFKELPLIREWIRKRWEE